MDREKLRQFLLAQAAEAQVRLWRFMTPEQRRASLAASKLWSEIYDNNINATLDRYAELYNQQPPNP